MKELFHKIASRVSVAVGAPTTFLLAFSVVLVWAITGPLFGFSDTWQLVINTGTTIITFLMVFLIQNTQNRDAKAVHLKLNELIRSGSARDSFVDLEDLNDNDLHELDTYFKELRAKQAAPAGVGKLHEKIAAEHRRRMTLSEATHALGNMLKTPINVHPNHEKK